MQKYLNKLLIIFATSMIFLAACKKEETNVLFKGGTPPVLTSSLTDSIPLDYSNASGQAIAFSWTNPNYQFSNGISSMNVGYNLQFDTVGANFTSPNMQTVQVSPALGTSFTVDAFNSLVANGLMLDIAQTHNIQVRVVSFIAPYTSGSPNLGSLPSNSINYKVVPYAPPPKVAPPTNGTLWLTGDASTSNYTNPLPSPYDVSQKFTMISPTLYELTVNLSGGGGYKLIQEQGNWDTQYHMITGGIWSGGSFEKKNSDPPFPGPPTAGNYKIQVNFQAGTYTVTKQ